MHVTKFESESFKLRSKFGVAFARQESTVTEIFAFARASAYCGLLPCLQLGVLIRQELKIDE